MSYSTVYKIQRNGEIQEQGTARNSNGFGMAVWRQLGAHYGMRENFLAEDLPIWGEFARGRLTDDEDIVLGSTFDRVWVRRDHIDHLVTAFRNFYIRHCNGLVPTLMELADHLEGLQGHDILGVCFQVTSLSDDLWYIRPSKLTAEERVSLGYPASIPEGEPEELTPYNFVRDAGKKRMHGDKDPWELFAALEQEKPR